MDNRLKYGILVVVGGVGVYLIWKGGYFQQWFPSLFGTSTTPANTPATPGVSTPVAITAPQTPATPPVTPVTTPANPAVISSRPPPPITPAAATQLVSQQMVKLAGKSDGLSADEWCYFYTQATGNDCPVDPGSIDSNVYHDAGVVDSSGNAGDRSTPTDIGTWLAIMQNQAPSIGLSGLEGLAAMHVANAWLV